MKTRTVNGLKLAFVDQGQGPVLMLVHGFPLDHTMWNGQINPLGRHCRVIVPDLRGFGASDVTSGTTTMAQMADDLARLLDALAIDQPVVLCGLSMGGYVAMEFYRRHAARLKGLILCDTRATADTPEAAAGRRETARRVLEEGPGFLAETMLPKLLAETTFANHPRVAEVLRQTIRDGSPEGIAAAARGMAERADSRDLLPRIGCSTLVVVGAADAIAPPAEMRAMAEAIPDARLVIVPDAGHMSPAENPAAFNAAVLEFVGKLSVES